MSEKATLRTDALKDAAERRIELKQALSQVETAAASPSGEPGWRDNLIEQLEDLRCSLHEHVEEVEADDGLLAELTEIAPRLVNQIAHVRDEHPGLCDQVEDTIGRASDGVAVPELRVDVLKTLTAIASHRQKGADLVYEGYEVDIGGS